MHASTYVKCKFKNFFIKDLIIKINLNHYYYYNMTCGDDKSLLSWPQKNQLETKQNWTSTIENTKLILVQMKRPILYQNLVHFEWNWVLMKVLFGWISNFISFGDHLKLRFFLFVFNFYIFLLKYVEINYHLKYVWYNFILFWESRPWLHLIH